LSYLYSANYKNMSNGALTGMIKHSYKNKLLTKQSDWIEMFWAVYLKNWFIQSNEIDPEVNSRP